MTRKEMIETIAQQANCSKRKVRKKLFQLSARMKQKRFEHIKFNEAFLNANTDWKDFQEVYEEWKSGKLSRSPWRIVNRFETIYFPTGCNVMFDVASTDDDLYPMIESCGTRLYNFKNTRF